jgi:UDP-N-acetylmuramate dehydrogenase
VATIDDIVRWRREHQPGGQNAGSVFTNPPGDSAGRVIDAAGLKGYRRGTARVSEKHANFIQADDRGSADDVFALVQEVQQLVEARTGIRLAVELHTVGFPDQPSSLTRESAP